MLIKSKRKKHIASGHLWEDLGSIFMFNFWARQNNSLLHIWRKVACCPWLSSIIYNVIYLSCFSFNNTFVIIFVLFSYIWMFSTCKFSHWVPLISNDKWYLYVSILSENLDSCWDVWYSSCCCIKQYKASNFDQVSLKNTPSIIYFYSFQYSYIFCLNCR